MFQKKNSLKAKNELRFHEVKFNELKSYKKTNAELN